MNFEKFSQAVHARYLELSQGELFVVGGDQFPDMLWTHYLSSFPEGTNLLYIKNSEHDCSCCRHWIKNLGKLVGIGPDGKYQTMWQIDATGVDEGYIAVAKAMDLLIRVQPITNLFRTKWSLFGAKQTTQLMSDDKPVKVWNHFHGHTDRKHLNANPDTITGAYRTTVQVFERGMEELKIEHTDTVLGLIEQGTLYRGEESLSKLQAFRRAQHEYSKLNTEQKKAFVWLNADSPISRLRNTALGTLLIDLSGTATKPPMDLEDAVKAYEAVMAPTNYKRPTALITPTMVKKAMETINTLGLEHSLERRFATLPDISVSNVLWTDSSTRSIMKSPLENALMGSAKTRASKKPVDADKISIEDFMINVLPKAESLEVLVQGSQMSNFMTLTAPVHPDTPKIFKWDNSFAWSYDGNITDSIKEKVKKAGGNVTNAALRISLAWFNSDDLDLHVYEPGGVHIYFGNKCGKLDVDMNAGYVNNSKDPVENVSYTLGNLRDGVYRVVVNQYSQRSSNNPGFVVELESQGQLHQFSYAEIAKGAINVFELMIKKGVIESVNLVHPKLVGGGISKEKWGVHTEAYNKVNTFMYSPNYWDENAVGNRHYFFILEGCKNPDPVRGIYNEFLAPELEPHRKVFEVLGDKTKCQPTEQQLSGIGFSRSGEVVTVKADNRTYQVQF